MRRHNVVLSNSPRLFYQESHLNNLLGSLVREGESLERRLQTVEQLREWLKQVDPSKVNQKMVPKLTNAICRAFVWRQKELRVELIECVKLLGKNLGDYIPLFFHHFRLNIDPDAQNNEQQQRFNAQFPGVPELSDEEKSTMLKPTIETVQHYAVSCPEMLPAVVTELAILLSHANSADVYVPVVSMFIVMLPQYIELIGPFFHDIVDVCLGWYISAAQRRDSVRRETERLLMLLHPLFYGNPLAVVEFLLQFSVDIDKYITEYRTTLQAETLDKVFSLFEIFKIVSDSFTGGRLQSNTAMQSANSTIVVRRLLIDVSTPIPCDERQRLLQASFHAIGSFVMSLPSAHLCELTELHNIILKYLFAIDSEFTLSTSVALLKLVSKTIRAIGSLQMNDFLQPLFALQSPIFTMLPFAENCELVEAAVEVFHAAFASKQVALVTLVYGSLADKMKASFYELSHAENPDTSRCERQLLFGLAALRRISTDKMDLFGVHLFNPTIFDLLSRHIRPFGGPSGLESAHKLAIHSGLIQTAIFNLLVGHMQGHSYFVANSELVESGTNKKSETGKKSSKYLTKFLSELGEVLSSDAEFVDPTVRLMALNATSEVITQIISYRPSVLRINIISRLLNAVVRSTSFDDRESLLCAINCLSSLFPYAKFISRRIFVDLYEICLLHLGSNDEEVAKKCLCLVEQLAMSLQAGHLLEENALPSVAETAENDETSLASPFSGILMSFSNQFRYPNYQGRTIPPAMFATLVSYLLQASSIRPRINAFLDINSFASPVKAVHVTRFYFMAWLTALCDLANHCVASKLKTQLGKPQDTLLAFEAQLKNLAEESMAGTAAKRLSLNAAITVLDQNRKLIDLMDHLERFLYNAFEGTAVVAAAPPKQVRSFFVTNRGTCEEWLSRVRHSALTAAWASGAYEAAVRHGMEMLSDWCKLGMTHEMRARLVPVAACLTRCFCKLRSPALISGLYSWCVENCQRKLSWLKPAVTFCVERYEQCIKQSTQRIEDLVSDQNTSSSDRLAIAEFLLKLSIDCFEALHDWEAFDSWRDGIQQRFRGSDLEQVAQELLSSQYLSDLTFLHSFTFAQMDLHKTSDVCGWGFEELIKSVKQQNIRLIGLLVEQQNKPLPQNFDQQCNLLRDSISNMLKVTTSASGLPSVACLRDLSIALMENRLTSRLLDQSFNISLMASLSDDFFASNIAPDASAFGGAKINDQLSLKSVIDVTTFTKFRQHLTDSYDCGEHCLVNATAVRLARKQGLPAFASKLLLSQLQNHVYLIGGDIPPETAEGCIEQLAQMPADLLRSRCRSVFTLRCEYVKLFKDAGKTLEATEAALGFALSGLNAQQQNNQINQIASGCCAKQLLLVAKWLQSDSEFASSIDAAFTSKAPAKNSLSEKLIILKQIMDRSLPLSKLSLSHVMNPTEHLIGQLLAMAANQSPTSSKAWMQLGGWCHFWGRKAISDAQTNGLQLSDEEYRTVVGCLPPSVANDQLAFAGLVKIITKLDQAGAITLADSSENNADSDYHRDSSLIEQQLVQACPILAQTPEVKTVLMAVWRAARQRLFTLYNMAGVAYFSFLSLNPQITDQTALASLRILRLLAKHAWELQAILENSLQSSPVGPWRAIVPQLFARLGHPEPYVRKAIADLLCRIALTAPHEIVYPAVAGFYAYGGSASALHSSANSPDSGTQIISRSHQQQQSEDLKECYSQLVEALAAQNASLVAQVSDFVAELTRIAVLWDEMVLNILAAHHSAISRRFSQLNDELVAIFAAVDRHHLTKNEANVIAQWKYAQTIKPILALFDSVRKLTSFREPETDHERWFSSTLLPIIDSTIEALKKPQQLGKSVRHSQNIVKQLLTALQQGSASLQAAGAALNLEFMSPNLVSEKFKDAAIPLPGSAVTLYAVEPQIFILPTKTKPKKISFVGSDGKTYSYLLKGIEDLHLDERMMQLLRLVNTTFTEQPGFRARNYAVTPLGRRSGLIQWVDGVTPAFTIYKRWQQRNVQASASNPQNPAPSVAIPRPSELYFNTTNAILKKAGLQSETRREKIPASIQRRALEQLVQDTPSDLFSRELWASSANSPDWFRKLSSFNKSIAAMSIVGYIIGLGDRHLDNVLIDLARAEVVHIDYNVCFEKGQRLRIPEKVPFRMSQNFEKALGVFGCEGLFRNACEYVMSQLRQGKEVLLTLLEAFLYDPLIDWTLSDNNADDRGDVSSLDHLLPRGVVIDLHVGGVQLHDDTQEDFSSTVPKLYFKSEYMSNMASALLKIAEHREDVKTAAGLLESFSEFASLLRNAEAAVSQHKKIETHVVTLRQCRKLVNDGATRQQMSSLPKRLQSLQQVEAELLSLKQTIMSATSEETEKQTCASEAIAALSASGPLNMVKRGQPVSFSRVIASVTDFLSTVGQTQLISQMESLERELDSDISSKFSEALAPLAQEAFQFFLNRSSPYFTSSKTCTFTSLELLQDIDSLLSGLKDEEHSQEIELVEARIENECSVLERWTNYPEFLLPKWQELRRSVEEAAKFSAKTPKADSITLNAALQASLANLRSDPTAAMIGLANSSALSGSIAAAASFCFVALDWVCPQVKPFYQWLPLDEDPCGLFSPLAVIEFLLTIVHTIGDDLRSSLPVDLALLLEYANQSLAKLHNLSITLLDSSVSFVSSLVPKFYQVILSNESPALTKALRSGKAEEVQWYIERLLTNSEPNADLSTCVQLISSKLNSALVEVFPEGSLNPAIYPRLFVSHAILHAEAMACHATGRLSSFQTSQQDTTVFHEVQNCMEKLFYDPENGLAVEITKITWQLLAAFLGIANFAVDPNQPMVPPDIRFAIPHLFMLDDQSTFPYAVSLFERFKETFLVVKIAKFNEISAGYYKANLANQQAVLAAFEWFNGDILMANGGEHLNPPTWKVIAQRLEESEACVKSIELSIASGQNKFSDVCSKIMQRLKWAAGSNPDINETLARFCEEKDKADSALEEKLENFKKTSKIFRGCRLFMEYQLTKRRLSILNLSSSILKSLKSVAALQRNAPRLTEDERILIDSKFVTPELNSIDEIATEIARVAASEEQKLSEAEEQKRKAIEAINNRAGAVRRHLKTLLEFAQSLSPALLGLKRIEDLLISSITVQSPSTLQYFTKLCIAVTEFTDHASQFQRLESNFKAIGDPQVFANVRSSLGRFIECVNVFTSLSNEAMTRACSASEESSQALDQFINKWFAENIERQVSLSTSNILQKSATKSSSSQQIWNQQALAAWQRIRAKLDGRDSVSREASRLNVVDHVSLLICQSKDIDNLAAMYEGWTPWV